VAFFAIGAYGYAFLSGASRSVADLPFPVVIPLVMLLAALGGVLLGIPVLRLRGDYLAIVTLGFGEIIRLLVNNLTHLTGGPQGILQIPRPRLLGFEFHDPAHFFYLILIGCVIVAFVSARLNDSRIGRAWIAIREDEDVARALGINVWQHKLLAFGIGASFAGLGGAIFASRQSAIFPVDFTLLVSIYVLCLVIIGGMGSIPGVVLGSAILVGLPEVLRELADYRLLAFGALLVLTMAVRPEGLLPSWRRASEIHEQAGEDAVETTFEPAGMAGEPRR
jgi:branched-chain amino acid transport system permease protein